MKKSNPETKRISNRRARYDYILGETFNVGVVLSGAEAKSLRLGHGHLQGAYVTIKGGELWLVNAAIQGTNGVNIDDQDQTRSRKLLAKQYEIKKMQLAKDQGSTIVPLELLTGQRYIKLRIALGNGKRQYDKRAVLKKRDSDRSIKHVLKSRERF